MSKTRQAFMHRKTAIRRQRADDAYEKAHSFWCKGYIEGREGLKQCKFQVMFRYATEGALATCVRCRQVHTFKAGIEGTEYKEGWYPVLDKDRPALPEPKPIVHTETEKQEQKRKEARHESWCTKKDKDLYGATRKEAVDGRVQWWRPGEHMIHVCFPVELARVMQSKSVASLKARRQGGMASD